MRSRRRQPAFAPAQAVAATVAASMLVLAAAQATAGERTGTPAQAAKRTSPGKKCHRPGAKTKDARGRTLICVRKGRRRLVWKLQRRPAPQLPPAGDPNLFITASPIDLTQVYRVSRFRSCYGHDYSGLNADGQPESNRSMKHYIEVIPALHGAAGQIKMLSPFDGKVVATKEDGDRGKQIWIKGTESQSWFVRFFHGDPLPSVVVGKTVKSGELVAYAAPPGVGANFDISLEKFDTRGSLHDSIFLHLAPTVAQAFAARGLTPANAVTPAAERDATPCVFAGSEDSNSDEPWNWIALSG